MEEETIKKEIENMVSGEIVRPLIKFQMGRHLFLNAILTNYGVFGEKPKFICIKKIYGDSKLQIKNIISMEKIEDVKTHLDFIEEVAMNEERRELLNVNT